MNEKYYFVLLALSLLNRAQPNSQLPKIQAFKSDVCLGFAICSLSFFDKNWPRRATHGDSNDDNDVALWHNS